MSAVYKLYAPPPPSAVPDAPVVRVSLGGSLRLADIQEGDDVYLECDVTASPPAERVQWRRNVRTLPITRRSSWAAALGDGSGVGRTNDS